MGAFCSTLAVNLENDTVQHLYRLLKPNSILVISDDEKIVGSPERYFLFYLFRIFR